MRTESTVTATRSQFAAAFTEWREMADAGEGCEVEIDPTTNDADFFMHLLRKHGAR